MSVEAGQASWWSPLADLWAWSSFRLSRLAAGARDAENTADWDAVSRYFGEVLIRQLGGEWALNPDGPPYIKGIGLGENGPKVIPMQLTRGLLARRTGHLMSKVATNNLKAQQGA